jgi:ParB-like chromosome segregation protein Spo0J
MATPRKRVDKGKAKILERSQRLEHLVIEYVPILSIKPNSYNPNRQSEHEFELLCKSMDEDGFTQPIVVMKDSREIIDGEHRWRAADKLGYAEVPVVWLDKTEAERRIATLRHNRARGSEDIELTASLFRDLQELGALDQAQDALMLDDLEMNKMLEDITAAADLAGEEFSEAWEPGEDLAQGERPAGDGSSVTSLTPAAVEAIRQQETKVAEAKTEQDRQEARRESTVYRVALTFAGEEATLVKATLGERPAEAVLRLCQYAHLLPAEVRPVAS